MQVVVKKLAEKKYAEDLADFESKLFKFPEAAEEVFIPSLSEEQARSFFTTDQKLPPCKVNEHPAFAFARQLGKDTDIAILDWKCHVQAARRAALKHALACTELQALSSISQTELVNDAELYSSNMVMNREIEALLKFKAALGLVHGLEAGANAISSDARKHMEKCATAVCDRSFRCVTAMANTFLTALPEGDINRGFQDWAIDPATLDMEKVLKLVNDKNVISLGRSIQSAETTMDAIEVFHRDSQIPEIVFWREKALKQKKETAVAEDGYLAWLRRAFFKCKFILAAATALKVIHVRTQVENFLPKDKNEAIERVRATIKGVSVDKDSHSRFIVSTHRLACLCVACVLF